MIVPKSRDEARDQLESRRDSAEVHLKSLRQYDIIKKMVERLRIAVALGLVVAVLGMFVSIGVPMPKSVLGAKQLASAISMHVTAVTIAVAVMLVSSLLVSAVVSQPSGTELINRLCSRIC
jgi:hypothetical protein